MDRFNGGHGPLLTRARIVRLHGPDARPPPMSLVERRHFDARARRAQRGKLQPCRLTWPYASSPAASARAGARRSRDDMIVTGSGHGMASPGSSNAIDTSSDGS